MYEDLIKSLKKTSMYFGELDTVSVLLLEAADAIEELRKAVLRLEDESGLYDELPTYYIYPAKWIPVAERLPEDGEIVLVDWWNIHCPKRHNLSVMKFYKGNPVDKVDPYKGIRFCDQWKNNKVPYAWAAPHGPLQLFGQDVTHWIPLPQPPKEGE